MKDDLITRMRKAMKAVRDAEAGHAVQRRATLPHSNLLIDLDLHTREWVHVRLLYWLLDNRPVATHECGSAFLEAFINLLKLPANVRNLACREVPDLFQLEYSSELRGRRHRPDLVLVWHRDLALLVEEKILAKEGPSQLSRYLNVAERDFSDVPQAHRFVILLTLDGAQPNSLAASKRIAGQVVSLSLSEVADALLSKYQEIRAPNQFLLRLLEDYKKLAERLSKKGQRTR